MLNTTHTQHRQAGITIIEVLTAMVVAMIGVFGVMILIPFAVKQSEVGLDLDDAYRQAQSGVAMFEIDGYQRLVYDAGTALRPAGFKPRWIDTAGNQVATPDVYAIDPLSIFGNGGTFNQFPPSFSVEQFETGLSMVPPNLATRHFPFIGELNLAEYNSGTGAITTWTGDEGIAMARRMFRNQDDLIFANAADDLSGPTQVYDEFSSPLLPPPNNRMNVGRQSRGEMSWMSIVAPVYDADSVNVSGSAWKYRMFVMSYKDRVLTTAGGMPIPVGTGRFPVGEIDSTSRTVTNAKDIGYGGGNITLTEPIGDVRKDDWLMLINLNPDLPAGFQKQIGFFRVIATFNEDTDNDGDVDRGILSLKGPDFVFNRRDTTGAWVHMPTFAVLLANYDAAAMVETPPRLQRLGHVVSVHERSFAWEQESEWNR